MNTYSICMICLESTTAKPIACGHQFHSRCIKIWADKYNSCPLCRVAIDKNKPIVKCEYSSPEEDRALARNYAQNVAGEDFNEFDMMQALINSIVINGEFQDYNFFCSTCHCRPCQC
jgi:hypothetical protein